MDGLAAYTFIGAVESLGSFLMTGLALPGAAAGRLSLRRRPSPPAEHYRQHGLLYRFRIGNCAGCAYRLSDTTFFPPGSICTAMRRFLPHGLVISSTAFVLLGVIRVAGYYYQATGKITDSSLLIYGDALSRCPCVCLRCRCGSVWTAYGWHAGFACCCFCSSVTCGSAVKKTPAVQNAAFFARR